jgi:hypothetical protein
MWSLVGVYVSASSRNNFYKAVKYYIKKRDKFIENVMKEVSDVKIETIENDPRHLLLLTITSDINTFCDKTLKSEKEAQQKLISEMTLQVCRRVSRLELLHDVDALHDLVSVYPKYKGQLCYMLELCLDNCGFLKESIEDAERCFDSNFNKTIQTMGFDNDPEDCVNDSDNWSDLDEEDKKTAKEIREQEKKYLEDDLDEEHEDHEDDNTHTLNPNLEFIDVYPTK